jgi:hypothetical protein
MKYKKVLQIHRGPGQMSEKVDIFPYPNPFSAKAKKRGKSNYQQKPGYKYN